MEEIKKSEGELRKGRKMKDYERGRKREKERKGEYKVISIRQ